LGGALPTLIKWKVHFFVAAHKNVVVAKVVENGDMKNPAKYGAKISKVCLFKRQNPSLVPLKSKQTSSR
jgi:hypothetical protein